MAETVDANEALNAALLAFRDLLGEEGVLEGEPAIERFARSTTRRKVYAPAIVRPRTVAHVQECMRIANRYGVAVYPVSTGRNWGYGDAAPCAGGQVIVDLAFMNKIVHVDRELGIAVVEPGVTQGQLAAYLREENIPFWLDVTGAGPDAGILGNVLERGFGHTPWGDHFVQSAGYDVVLADGRLLSTGFGRFEDARARYAYKHGVGPTLDGLFTQSNFGVVVRLGVYLMPIPESIAFFHIAIQEEQQVGELVDCVRDMRLHGLLPGTIHVANDLRIRSGREGYPWNQYPDGRALPARERAAWRAQNKMGSWTAFGALTGPRHVVRALAREVRKRGARVGTVGVVESRWLDAAKGALELAAPFGLGQPLRERLARIHSGLELLRGTPTAEHLRGTAWRARSACEQSTADPLDNGSGLMWHVPIAPMTGRDAELLTSNIARVMTAHDFEPLMTLVSLSPRALCCVTSLCFDRTNHEEARRAETCLDALWNATDALGYYPYRCGNESMAHLEQGSSDYQDVLRSLKAALDPAGIVAPGRYTPPSRARSDVRELVRPPTSASSSRA